MNQRNMTHVQLLQRWLVTMKADENLKEDFFGY